MKSIAEIFELANQYDLELPPAPEGVLMPVGNEINALIDHTLLKAEASPDQVKQLCQEAVTHRFASVCVNPVYVPLVAGLLSGSQVKTCGVIGFRSSQTSFSKAASIALSSGDLSSSMRGFL